MKAILFDAGNTLLYLDHAFLVSLLREHGVETSGDALLAAEYDARLLVDEQMRGGRLKTDEDRGRAYVMEVLRRVGTGEALFPALAARLEARHLERNLWCVVRERTAETLAELRASGYRLGVVSNSDGRVEGLLEEEGLRPYFDFVIDSARVGVEKPDPRIFRLACERAGVEPHEAAYVGDLYEVDVVGARAVGMRAFLVDPLGRMDHLDCERIAGIHELPARLAEVR